MGFSAFALVWKGKDFKCAIVVSFQKVSAVGLATLLLLAGCSKSVQEAFSADPRLTGTSTASQPTPAAQRQLPPKFPSEIPKYPNATLLDAQSTGEFPIETSTDLLTRWSSSDARDRVFGFYRDELQKNGWKLDQQQNDLLVASRQGLKLAIAVQAAQTGTNFTIETKSQPQSGETAQAPAPKPGEPNFVGPVPAAKPVVETPSGTFSDLDKAPQELRQYAKDLAQLGILNPQTKSNQALFEPNKGVTRRVYARWLVAANNRIYANRPARQIRLGVESAQAAFQDVSAKDPDFGAIQGLAEAGLIPSPLSRDSTATLFRPDAPLSREDLILWKIPTDTRQALPNATIESVKQTWGFQDVDRIEPKALRAVYVDNQNGDQANIRRAFGYTTLFQPKRPVTRAEAAAVLWYFGFQGDGISAQDALKGTKQ